MERTKPKTEFTFYSKNNEAELISALSAERLAYYVCYREDQVIHILFELWRTDRDEDIFRIMNLNKGFYLFEKSFAIENIAKIICSANINNDVSTEKLQEFIADLFTLKLKTRNGFDYDKKIDDEIQQEVWKMTASIIGRAGDIKNHIISIYN